MKKSILIWAMLLMVSVTSTFANPVEGVSEKIINAFRKDFAQAQNVQWESSKDFVKATFTLHEQVMFAYYSAEGSLLAVSRNITTNQLPISLLADVKKNYGNYWITDLFEMAAAEETSYYVTLENAEQKLILKSVDARGWETYKKDKKDNNK